jgi:anti-sigma B factor antagonist
VKESTLDPSSEPGAASTVRGSVLLRRDEEQVHILVTGEVDMSVADDFYRATALVAAEPAPAIILDVAAVTFADSTLLHGIARLHRISKTTGATLVIANPSPSIHRLLAITGLQDLIEANGAQPG